MCMVGTIFCATGNRSFAKRSALSTLFSIACFSEFLLVDLFTVFLLASIQVIVDVLCSLINQESQIELDFLRILSHGFSIEPT
jgi:hypothetical protein